VTANEGGIGGSAPELSVALSMLTLVPGGMGGSETYARALSEQLVGLPGIDVTAFVPSAAAGFSRGVPEVQIPGLYAGQTNVDRLRTLVGANLLAPRIRRAMAGNDVVHFPFTVPAPRPSRRQASVQSLLDVQHLELPHMFSKTELAYRRLFYEGYARRADAVITISHFAKRRMVELLGIAADRIHVAQLGVDTSRFTANLGTRENFILYPARGWAHKNHAALIKAVEIQRLRNPELRLVLTGGGLDVLGALPDWVDRRGLVSEAELLELYRTAGAMIFPSLYEGFGLPPLEAMASGCPVAVSTAGSLPEVVGDAAVTFDATDPAAIAEAIEETFRRSAELSAAGLVQVTKFTWQSCRDVHIDAYRQAQERHNA
jgi:glycosyltransferase involved in cell wall biosynthesis